MPAHPARPRVVIVGGGVAGLATATLLRARARAPLAVTVLEAAPRAGGNLRTDRVDGYTCEWGPNGFLDSAPDTLALVSQIGLADRVQVSDDAARRRFLFRNGRLHRLPEGPGAFLTSPVLSLSGRLRVLGEPFAPHRPAGDETIHAFAARRIGREAADVLVDAMVSGVFGGNAQALSLRACFPKMWEMEEAHGGLVRAMIARRRERRGQATSVAPAGRLTSFAGGVQELVDTLGARLGDNLRLGSPVTAIEPRAEGGWRVRTAGDAIDAEAVVLANGTAAAATIVETVEPALAAVLRSIPSAPLAVVALGFDRATFEHPVDGFGFLVPRSEGLPLLGALWDSTIYPGRAPQDRVLLRVMLGGAHDPATVALDDPALLTLARSGLARTMGVQSAPVWTRVFRHPAGIPQYTVGHLDRLAAIDAALLRLPGLHVTGNGYRGVAINACISDAGATADRILHSL